MNQCYCGSIDSVVHGVCWQHQHEEWLYRDYLEREGYTPREVETELNRWGREQREEHIKQMGLWDEEAK